MGTFEQSMEEIFQVSSDKKSTEIIPAKNNQLAKVEDVDLGQDLTDAYNQSRDNIQQLIDQGREAMDEILEIAKQGQHPRAFEVYGSLLKNMVDANKELLNIQKQIREMDKDRIENSTTNIDKAIFVGSTTELAMMLKDVKK